MKTSNMRAVIYARYSSYAQSEQSIDGQLRDCTAFAEREGYTIVGHYIDRAQSARTADRTDFQRMIADSSKKEFDFIIVWKLDRFARDRYDAAFYKRKLRNNGVTVLSAMERISNTPEGIIMEGMLEAMAEYYSANLATNVKRGMRETVKKGLFPGGTVPIGYVLKDRHLYPDERKSPAIRKLFEEYVKGTRPAELIRMLAAHGILTKRGELLSLSQIARLLANPVYKGEYTYNGEIIPGVADAIIDSNLFERAQQRLAANKKAPGRYKAHTTYQLLGKAFCGDCGSTMIGDSGYGRHQTLYSYYSCSKRKKHHTCKKHTEKKDFLEWYVVEQTCEYVLTPARTSIVAKAVVDHYNNSYDAKHIAELERIVNRLNGELNNLVDALAEVPKAGRPRIYEKMELLEAQLADAEDDLIKTRAASALSFTEEEVKAWLKLYCTGDPLDESFRQQIIDTFINSVYVYDDRILIFYNLRDAKQVSYIDLPDDLKPTPTTGTTTTGTTPNSAKNKTNPNLAGSDLSDDGTPERIKSEPHFIFVKNVFGCIFWRKIK